MNNLHSNNYGYSLIEVIVYIALASILAVSITSFYIVVDQSRAFQQHVSAVHSDTQRAIELMSESIKNATAVSSPPFQSNANSLSVTDVRETNNPVQFYIQNDELYIQKGVLAPIALTDDSVEISNLLFESIATVDKTQSIKISFDVSSAVFSNLSGLFNLDKTVTTTVSTRYYDN